MYGEDGAVEMEGLEETLGRRLGLLLGVSLGLLLTEGSQVGRDDGLDEEEGVKDIDGFADGDKVGNNEGLVLGELEGPAL